MRLVFVIKMIDAINDNAYLNKHDWIVSFNNAEKFNSELEAETHLKKVEIEPGEYLSIEKFWTV